MSSQNDPLGAMPLCRSLLFVPGSRPERVGKAVASGADIVMVDLEDAVAPDAKDSARAAVLDELRALNRTAPAARIHVRINSPRTRAGLADLQALTAPEAVAAARCDGLLLPKVESAVELRLVAEVLAEAGHPATLGALIETAEGLAQVHAIARAQPRLRFLMFGGADLAAELRVPLAWAPLVHARAAVVHAAARAGLDVIDMPWIDLHDDAGHAAEIEAALALGFTGKAAIHPKQVAAIHAALAPTAEAVAEARRVVAAWEAAGRGVCTVDGRLVERPLLAQSLRRLRLAEAAHDGAARD